MALPERQPPIYEETQEGTIIHVPADIDEYSAPDLTDVITEQIANGVPEVILDLTQAAGVEGLSRLIMTARRDCLRYRKRLTFLIPEAGTMSVFFDEMGFSKHYKDQVQKIPRTPGISQP